MEIDLCLTLRELTEQALKEMGRACCSAAVFINPEHSEVPFGGFILTLTCPAGNHLPYNAPFKAGPEETNENLKRRLVQVIGSIPTLPPDDDE